MRRCSLALCLTFVAAVAAAGEAAADAAAERPERWADPIAVDGLPNLHRVSDVLYRSAQPTEDGFRRLSGIGVRSVLSLRAWNSDRDELEGTGLGYRRISFKTWHAEDEDVVAFLKFVADPANQPVLVHCLHGADRTGTMCAVYRIVVQGWTVDDALHEMTDGSYGYHEVWVNLPRYLRRLDVERLRRAAGLAAPAAAAAP